MDVPAPMLPSTPLQKIVTLPSELQPASVDINRLVIVGTESHPFVGSGSEYPGTRCAGRLGNVEGSFCGALRSEPIHEGYRDWCSVCDGKIKAMAFKGTGVCSEIHRKQRDGEPINKFRAVAP